MHVLPQVSLPTGGRGGTLAYSVFSYDVIKLQGVLSFLSIVGKKLKIRGQCPSTISLLLVFCW